MSFIRLKAICAFSDRSVWSIQIQRTDIFNFFEVVVVRPQIYEILSSFVEFFGHPSPDSYLFFDCEVFKGLRNERQFTQGHLAYWTRRRAEREESIDARFAPVMFRKLSMRFAGEIEGEWRTFCDSTS